MPKKPLKNKAKKQPAKTTKTSATSGNILQHAAQSVLGFVRENWKGTLVILFATILFFMPMIIRINSYSEGGDAMFNAWTLSRNHHCIMRENCPSYKDSNIYFPNKDTMLYSETQTSAGLLTLPLYWINNNPIFTYNVWTIVSFFLGGWFMYLLAKYLSKGKEYISILAALVFEFAPFKLAAIFHLQNLSIFYLPLAVLLTLRYFDTSKRKYLPWLFIVLTLQFYASWYNMVFVLAVMGLIILGALIFKFARPKVVLIAAAMVLLAVMATIPLAKEYIRFSKANKASFSLKEQMLYSSDVADYFIPHEGTAIGKLYYQARPGAQHNAFNLDSFSYHSLTLYAVAAIVIVMAFLDRKKKAEDGKRARLVFVLTAIGLIGLIFSFGPILKINGHQFFGSGAEGFKIAIVAPYMLVMKVLPQLKFIRGLGRWSVLFLFTLCCLLALSPYYLEKIKAFKRHRKLAWGIIGALLLFELMPLHFVPMSKQPYAYNLSIPEVYKYVRAHKEVDKLLIIQADSDYPNAPIPIVRAEWVLWAGYHNRNMFNGYSGYTPPTYDAEYIDYKDFNADDVVRMKSEGLQYVIVDKQLSTMNPQLDENVGNLASEKLYEDQRYALFKM